MLHRVAIIVAVVFMTMGGAAMAAPKGDQGPPEHAQGNGPPAAPRGNANGHQKHASPQTGGQGKARGHAKADTGSGGSARKGEGGSGTQEQGSGHAKAGKVTLCHAMGSVTNPYVEIVISTYGF